MSSIRVAMMGTVWWATQTAFRFAAALSCARDARKPEFAAPRRFYATTGISVTREGVDHSEDVSLAARNALLNMIDQLTERGWTRQQAYAICSVAVDLKISQLVDVPNMLVSAFLPEDIFVK